MLHAKLKFLFMVFLSWNVQIQKEASVLTALIEKDLRY